MRKFLLLPIVISFVSSLLNAQCLPGYIEDCNGNCYPIAWIGDGVCDNGYNVNSNFLCEQFNWDDGDCGVVSCGPGFVTDCDTNCVSIQYIGDGQCHNSDSINFECANFLYDGGDCINWIADCDGELFPDSVLSFLGNWHCNNSIFTNGGYSNPYFNNFYFNNINNLNFDCLAFNFDSGDCDVLACTDTSAINYYEHATIDDGSCLYADTNNVSCTIDYPNILKENIQLPSNSPRGLCVMPDSTSIYIGTDQGVVVVDLDNNIGPYLIPTNGLIYSCSSSLDGDYVFAANWSQGVVDVIETSSNTIINSITSGAGTLKMKTSNNGQWVAASNYYNNTVSIINADNFQFITNISVGQGPRNIDFSSNDSLLYVANWTSGTLGVYSTTTWQEVVEVTVDYWPQAVCALPGDDYVLVANFGYDLSYDHISVIRTSDWQVIARLQTGAGPEDIGLLGQNGEYIYVSNWGFACCHNTSQNLCCSAEIDKGTLTIISTPNFDSISPPLGTTLNQIPYIQSTLSTVKLDGEYSFGLDINPNFSEVYIVNKSSNTLSIVGFEEDTLVVVGCTDSSACNYNPIATCDDGSCTYQNSCSKPIPTGLYVDEIIHNRVRVHWDNMTDAVCLPRKYRIQYRVLGTTAWSQKNVQDAGLCNFGLPSTSKILKNLTPSTIYEYRIKGWYCCTTGASIWSPILNFTTADECPNVGNFSVSTPLTTRATFTWDDSNGPYSFVRIKLRVDSIQNPTVVDWFNAGGFGVMHPTFTRNKNGLTPGQTYRGQARTWCDPNGGAYKSLTWTSLIYWTQPIAIRLGGGSAIANLAIYPNPSRDVFNITFTSETIQDLKVRIVNVIGDELINEDLQQFIGEYTKQISLENNAKGIYFLEIETNEGVINKKLILQ